MIMAGTSPFSTFLFLFFTVAVAIASCSASGDREGVCVCVSEFTLMPAMYPGTRNRPCEIDESYHAGEWEAGKWQTTGQSGLRPLSFCMFPMTLARMIEALGSLRWDLLGQHHDVSHCACVLLRRPRAHQRLSRELFDLRKLKRDNGLPTRAHAGAPPGHHGCCFPH
jgi:hypothetical protein